MSSLPPSIRYVSDDQFKWFRKPHGENFRFIDDSGDMLVDEDLERVKKLVIPPAWTEVKISHDPRGHIQAVGFDAKGRKQYIYHPDWTAYNQQHKFDKMVRFGEVLPTLRETMYSHMRQRSLTQERVIATVVWLLEHTFIRVGNKEYAQENKSYGLTTLREKHVDVEGSTVNFSFKGKSGVYHELEITNPRVAKTVQQCIELPGFEIFQYVDDNGQRQVVDSHHVNEYLCSITGETLSAKDFRTWGGTTLAGDYLYHVGSPTSDTACQKALRQVTKEVSSHLRNTTTVCRKYYIHPTIVTSYESDTLVPHFNKIYSHSSATDDKTGLSRAEMAAWTLLKENS